MDGSGEGVLSSFRVVCRPNSLPSHFIGKQPFSNPKGKAKFLSKEYFFKKLIMWPSSISSLAFSASFVIFLGSYEIRPVIGLSSLLVKEPVSKLLQTHADDIAKLKSVCEGKLGADVTANQQPYCNDVFYLRYCIALPDDPSEQASRLTKNLEWRTTGTGKTICDAATSAIAKATSGDVWNNEVVLSAAPCASIVSKYITPSNVITTTSSNGDLVYCIRAGQIDDASLMSEVSVDQMVDFFLYAKEVNAQVANMRSADLDQLVCIITANDLTGVKLVGGSADFRKALGSSSNQANELYPAMAGPTLLLNLPGLLSALVKLFTPLFSKEVKARLKFQQGPLKEVSDLQEIASKASGSARTTFVQQLDDILYS
jgi:hypothetical protein